MGITFLNGLFGFAMAAVGLPILIHLLNRRRTKRVPFSSIEFLQEVTKQQRRRVQLRQWLLLVLRCLVVALVVLAMMRPAVRASFASGGGSTLAICVLDTSFSMSAADEEGSHRERAVRKIESILATLRGGDQAQLITMTRPPEVVFESAIRDLDRVASMASKAPVSYLRASGPEAVRQAMTMAAESEAINREIYLISDFQRDDWPLERETAIPERTRVYVVPVAGADLPNVAIASAAFVPIVPGSPAGAVRVGLRNHTDQTLENYAIRVTRGTEVVGTGAARIPPGEGTTTDLLLTTPVGAGEALQVRIPEDALGVDDVAWLTPTDHRAVRVLLVTGAEPSEVVGEPYLRLALDPPGSSGERPFTVEEIPLRDLPVQSDFAFDVIVLNNVERLSESAISKIQLAHKDGTGVLVVLGDRVDLRSYNTSVLPALIDVRLEEPLTREGSFFSLTPEVPGHPIFEGFRVGLGEDLTASKFRSIVRLRPGAKVRVLARFGEWPALVEAGGVLVFVSSADLRWGNFPTGGSFLPFIQQAVLSLAPNAATSRQFEAGKPISFEVPRSENAATITCVGPGEVPLAARPGEAGIVMTEPAPEPGLYRFESMGVTIGTVAVHVDPDEGRLEYAKPADVAGSLGAQASVLGEGAAIATRVLEARNGKEIWREILFIALVLMIVETLVGRVRFA
jgi:hypothetical protein